MSKAIRSPNKKKERKQKLAVALALFAVAVAVLLGIFAWMATSSVFQIKNIEIRGNEMFSGDELMQAIRKDISGKYFFLFPRSSIFFYPESMIKKEIQNSFPRFKNATFYISDARVLVVSLSERDPSALWCGIKMLSSVIDETCYYVDDSGFVFGKAPTFSGVAYMKFYGKGNLKPEDPIGGYFVSGDIFKKIFDIHEILIKYDKNISNVFLNDEGTLQFSGTKKCKILFDIEQPLASFETNIDAVFSSSDWAHGSAEPSEKSPCDQLEYLDFRFGNKVYYREKSKTPRALPGIEQTATSTANSFASSPARV